MYYGDDPFFEDDDTSFERPGPAIDNKSPTKSHKLKSSISIDPDARETHLNDLEDFMSKNMERIKGDRMFERNPIPTVDNSNTVYIDYEDEEGEVDANFSIPLSEDLTNQICTEFAQEEAKLETKVFFSRV